MVYIHFWRSIMTTATDTPALDGARRWAVDTRAEATESRGTTSVTARRILRLGATLFLLGLLSGFVIPMTANPRVALSSHLEGVMNGTFLLVLGAIWPWLQLGPRSQRVLFGLAAYGTFANWATTLLAAVIGAGGAMMPIAAGGFVGSRLEEGLIAAGLISLSISMLVVCPLLIWGLRRPRSTGA
jgi:hydroxylaminobenzene mutase